MTLSAHGQDGGSPGSFFRSFQSAQEAGRSGTGAPVQAGPFSGLSNPAALGGLPAFEAGADAAFRNFGRSARTLALAGPMGRKASLGLAWFSVGNGDALEARIGPSDKPEALFGDGQNMFELAGSYRAGTGAWTGLGLKLYQQRIDQISGVGFGLDLGGLWEPERHTRLALALRDLGGGLALAGMEREAFPVTWRFSSQRVLPGDRALAFLDLGGTARQEVRWGLGAELEPKAGTALRAGWSERRLGLGGSLRVPYQRGWLRLDYAVSSSPVSFWRLGHSLSLVLLWDRRRASL